ncbi:MAG: T9SS type A sorting domain-containing protein [Ignavibacteriae bacterium]|nr:T9SS type A sorting domain-containing protein [Ignavibacteriota bacterium]
MGTITRANVWNNGVVTSLGSLGGLESEVMGISEDGQIVIGYSRNNDGLERGCIWSNGTMVEIDSTREGLSKATGISSDGSIIIGWMLDDNGKTLAYRYSNGSYSELGSSGGEQSMAVSISMDGTVIIGDYIKIDGKTNAFRWTSTGGAVLLDSSVNVNSRAVGISMDGTVIIGDYLKIDGKTHAFRWTSTGGTVRLDSSVNDNSRAVSISMDGTVIIGDYLKIDGKTHAFRWTQAGGMEDLNDVYNCYLTGSSELLSCNAITSNGRYIVGTGYNASSGQLEGFLLDTGFPSCKNQLSFQVSSGWNIISVPGIPADSNYSKNALFPTASSPAFTFSNSSGYMVENTLRNGVGYWMKFPSAQTISIEGWRGRDESLAVATGWNMVGSMSERSRVESLTTEPLSMTTSSFFGYDRGYYVTEYIEPGKGYWVKADTAGIIILNSDSSGLASKNKIRIQHTSELPPPPPEGDGNLSETRNAKPESFALEQAYPNPFNPVTVIGYQLKVKSYVTLKVIDLLGREVAALVEGIEDAGVFRTEWNASDVPSGMYFYRISAQGEDGTTWSDVKKFVLLK